LESITFVVAFGMSSKQRSKKYEDVASADIAVELRGTPILRAERRAVAVSNPRIKV
jgi:hypothetical protein